MAKKDKKEKKKENPVGTTPLFFLVVFIVGVAAAVFVAWAGSGIVPEWVRGWEREMKNDDERFKGWAARMKVEAPSNAGLVHREAWGWAIQAQENINSNKTILIVPKEAVLSDMPSSATISKHTDEVEEIFNDDQYLIRQAELTIALLHERYLGKASVFREWIATLPEKYKNDLYWGTDEVSCVPQSIKRARTKRRVSVNRIHKFATRFFGFMKLTVQDVVWGFSTVLARSWRRDDKLVIYPIFDIADQRARHYGKGVWRPLPVNARLELRSNGGVRLISSKEIKKGDYFSVSPLPVLLPSDAVTLYGVLDPDFTHVLSHLDLSEASPQCSQETLLLNADGSATNHTEVCLLLYRKVPSDAPSELKKKTLSKFLTFHATHMLREWTVPETGACRAANLANMPSGPELLNLLTSHISVYRKTLEVYKMK